MAIVFYPKSNFNVPSCKELAKLSNAQFTRKITRMRDTKRLERALAPFLSQTYPIGIRGAADKSRYDNECYLVSGRPITWILSAAEVAPPRFFHKLYASITGVAARGFSDIVSILGSKEVILSFVRFPLLEGYYEDGKYSMYEAITKDMPRILEPSPGHTYFGGTFPGVQADFHETTFPLTLFDPEQDVTVGELKYKKNSILSVLPPHSSEEEQEHKTLKRNAVVYRDTLQMLVELIETESPNESILIK